MGAESFVRKEFYCIDFFPTICSGECFTTVRNILTVGFHKGNGFLSADACGTNASPGTIVVLGSQVSVVEKSYTVDIFFQGIGLELEIGMVDVEGNVVVPGGGIACGIQNRFGGESQSSGKNRRISGSHIYVVVRVL